ncbi:GGDEF domain-containing protein [Thioalkalivibrio denitrificans]|nr:GGDEF domain-containing protein [Thioalkalivibrio denitrificans]
MHPVGLWFACRHAESGYREEQGRILRHQARIALVLGMFLYGAFGLLDVAISDSVPVPALALRGGVLLVGLGALLVTWTSHFERHHQWPLMTAGLAAGLGGVGIMAILPEALAHGYATGLILVVIAVFLLLGISFLNALLVNLVILVAFAVVLVGAYEDRIQVLTESVQLLAALVLGGVAAYIQEYQRRELYVQRLELEDERNRHRDMALTDALTGLPNRALLLQRLEQAVARTRRHRIHGAGLFIDLDRFKPVNDIHGHEAGDRVLQAMGKRLLACVRETDTVARFGGDEFFVLLEDMEHADFAREVAARVVDALSQPVPIDSDDPDSPRVVMGASVGICEFPSVAATAEAVLTGADDAMYAVKKAGGNGFSSYRGGEPGEVVCLG